MPTRRARVRRHIYALLPQWLKRHDFELFAASLSIMAGVPILMGQVEPTSPEAVLPRPLVMVWAVVLVVGGILVITGVVVGNKHVYPSKMVWARTEALGLTALAYFCYLYSLCIISVASETGWSGALFIFGFGVVCHIREVAIQMELEEYRRGLGLRDRV